MERNQGAEQHVRSRDTIERWHSPERATPDRRTPEDGAAKDA